MEALSRWMLQRKEKSKRTTCAASGTGIPRADGPVGRRGKGAEAEQEPAVGNSPTVTRAHQGQIQ